MGVPQQVANELAIIAHLSGARPVAHSRRLHDAAVIPHAVDEGYKTVVEHRKLFPAERLEEGAPIGGFRRTHAGSIPKGCFRGNPTGCGTPRSRSILGQQLLEERGQLAGVVGIPDMLDA